MDMKNPYAAQLDDRDPLQVLAITPKRLAELSASLGESGMGRSLAPGKWTAREILSHLADCEVAFAFRLRQTLAEDFHVMQPFDQDKWAGTYAAYEAPEALSAFSALRRWNVRLIGSLSPAAFAKPVNHPERGDMTFQTIVETMAGHDINHLKQLEALAANRSPRAVP